MKTLLKMVLVAISLFAAAPVFAQSGTPAAKVEQPWFMQGKISGGISVSASSSPTALPSSGFVAWICNTGANDAYLNFGTDNTVAATVTANTWLKSGACSSYDLYPFFSPTKFTWVAAIAGTSTTTLTVETGTGNGPSQGAGGGGGGGSVTQGTSPWVDNITQWGGTNVVTGGVAGLVGVGGNVASGVTDAGNPVKVGGRFNTALPTLTNGQRGDLQMTASGAVIVDNRSIVGTTISVNTGVMDNGTQRIAIATDSPSNIGTGTAGSPNAQVVTTQGISGGAGFGSISDYPVGGTGVSAVPITATSGNVAAATATATLAGTAGKTTYISGLQITGAGATAGSVITCTVTGLVGSITKSLTLVVPTGATLGIVPMFVNFPKPIPASAVAGNIVASCPSFGTGNTNAVVNADGYQF